MSEKPKAVKRFNYDYISVIFLCGTAVVFLLDSTGIKDPDSRVFPLFVSSLAIALSVILVLKNLLHLGRAEEYDFTGTGRAMMMALSLFCYIVAIAAVGFYLSTPVYLYITMWLLGQRSQKLSQGVPRPYSIRHAVGCGRVHRPPRQSVTQPVNALSPRLPHESGWGS